MSSVLQSPYVLYGTGALAVAGAAGSYYLYTQYNETNSELASAKEEDKAYLEEKVGQWKMYGMISAAVAILAVIGTIYLYRKRSISSEYDDNKTKEESSEVASLDEDGDLELEEEQMMVHV